MFIEVITMPILAASASSMTSIHLHVVFELDMEQVLISLYCLNVS